MSIPGMKVKVDFKGGFFTRDPRKTFGQNVRSLMIRIGEEGESALSAQIQSLPMPQSNGRSAEAIRGRANSLSGKPWQRTVTIVADSSGLPAKEAISLRAAEAGIERRWHPARKVASGFRAARAVILADLTKGME